MERFHYKISNYDCQVLFSEKILIHGLFLCVLHADKIPPHLGLITNGLFYSLKANGKDEGVPVRNLLPIIHKRNITTLFFKLDERATSHAEVVRYFKSFPTKIGENETCLTPIKSLLQAPISTAHVGDLMNYLEQSNLILERLTLHLPKGFSGIPYYTLADITKRIQSLKDDKGKKSILKTSRAI